MHVSHVLFTVRIGVLNTAGSIRSSCDNVLVCLWDYLFIYEYVLLILTYSVRSILQSFDVTLVINGQE